MSSWEGPGGSAALHSTSRAGRPCFDLECLEDRPRYTDGPRLLSQWGDAVPAALWHVASKLSPCPVGRPACETDFAPTAAGPSEQGFGLLAIPLPAKQPGASAGPGLLTAPRASLCSQPSPEPSDTGLPSHPSLLSFITQVPPRPPVYLNTMSSPSVAPCFPEAQMGPVSPLAAVSDRQSGWTRVLCVSVCLCPCLAGSQPHQHTWGRCTLGRGNSA